MQAALLCGETAKSCEDAMTDQRAEPLDPPRRLFLRGAAIAAGSLVGPAVAAAGSAKVSQKLAHYQPSPNGSARCQVCSQFLPAPSCKVVEDPITPSGWCLLYAAKAG
jgi:hypothetical protein